MEEISKLIDALSDKVNVSELTDLDKEETLLKLADLKQEIHDRFNITSKPNE